MTVAELQAKSPPRQGANAPAEPPSVPEIQSRSPAAAYASRMSSAQTVPIRWDSAFGEEPAAANLDQTPDLVRSDAGAEEPRQPDHLARVIVAALAVVVLCGAVVAVAALRDPGTERLNPSPPFVQPARVTGPAVLRPNPDIARLTGGEIAAREFEPEPTGSSEPESSAQAGSAQGSEDEVAYQPQPGVLPSQPEGSLASPELGAQVVTDFYRALPLRKEEAFELLGPSMRQDGRAAFDNSWRGVRSVESKILRPDQDGAVLVAVSIEFLDGPVLRLVQRIEVRAVNAGTGSRLLIAAAELLSAHRG